MKNTIYIFMLLFAATLSSCGKEDIKQDREDGEQHEDIGPIPSYTSILGASAAVIEDSSRVSIGEVVNNDERNLFWTKGDQFTVLNKNGKKTAVYTLIGEGGQTTGSFGTHDAKIDVVHVVFPTNCVLQNPTITNDKLPVSLPTEYTNDMNPQNALMYGVVDKTGKNVQFYHTMAMLRIVFKHLPSDYKYIKVSSDRKIAGDAKLMLSGKNSKADYFTTKEVVIHRQGGQTVFYCPIPTSSFYKAIYVEKSKDGVTYKRAKYLVNTIKNSNGEIVGAIKILKKLYTIECGTEIDGDSQLDDLVDSNEKWN